MVRKFRRESYPVLAGVRWAFWGEWRGFEGDLVWDGGFSVLAVSSLFHFFVFLRFG